MSSAESGERMTWGTASRWGSNALLYAALVPHGAYSGQRVSLSFRSNPWTQTAASFADAGGDQAFALHFERSQLGELILVVLLVLNWIHTL